MIHPTSSSLAFTLVDLQFPMLCFWSFYAFIFINATLLGVYCKQLGVHLCCFHPPLLFSWFYSLVGKSVFLLQVSSQENNDVPPTFDLAGGNICLVTSMDKWEEKMSEANHTGKIVSFLSFFLSISFYPQISNTLLCLPTGGGKFQCVMVQPM